MLSKTCNYGIRAAIYLAIKENQGLISIQKIARDLNVPFHFLTKTLQQLTQNYLLVSTKGPKGGIRLAKPAKNITIMDIVLAIDGPDLFGMCLLGLPGCGVLNPCPLHDDWSNAVGVLKNNLNNTSLSSLAERVAHNHLRITETNSPEFLNDLGTL